MVDEVLPVAEIPGKIVSYSRNLGLIHISSEKEGRPVDQQQALREVLAQLKLHTGHDFTNYKRPTLLRRIERRLTVRNLKDLPSYAFYIQNNPDETTALLKDLLISVTHFFRDKKAFEAIEHEVLPDMIKSRSADEHVRIWVAGCATGEEAYSLAMLCAEQTHGILDTPKVQIFATDIDEAAIAHARQGRYTINEAADVSPERLRRFFKQDVDGYQVRREIREMILFANHNFTKDPPFSHVDMISCRNVLIYLNNTAQERVMETFHFALNPGGYLFLGSSESTDGAADLYTHSNRECHIYRSRQVSSQSYPLPESVPVLRISPPARIRPIAEKNERNTERITYGDLHQRLLEKLAPPSIVVNEQYDILHLSERAGKYLQISGGEPSQSLLKLIRQELRLELRSVLYQASQRKADVAVRGLKVNIDDRTETINIMARPVLGEEEIGRGFILVLFEPTSDDVIDPEVVLTSDEPMARQLEEELIRVKMKLRASNEQHEFQAEELKAANEELQAMNEEMRSAAEELETSKEELQSINEELRTVNQELKIKVEETTIANNNLQNLINSVDIATIFLDRSFRVNLFSPAARDIFNLIPADNGRLLTDITNRLDYHTLAADAELVLEKLQPVEREISSADGKQYLMRVLPYRTQEDRINGVVITFFDITKRKQVEKELQGSEERLRITMESATDYAIMTLDTKGCYTSWSRGAELIFGFSEEEAIGQHTALIFTPEDKEAGAHEMELEQAVQDGRAEDERWHVRKDGSRFFASGVMSPILDGNKLIGFVKVARDMTERKMIEQQKDDFIGIASHELKTPVTSIKAYAEVLQEIFKENADAANEELMSKLNTQVDRLTALISDLLDTTKVAEGKLVLQKESVDLNGLLDERMEELQRTSPKHKLVIKKGKTKAVIADKERLGQVLINLISNAIKYSPAGGEVIITSEDRGDSVMVAVRDFGIGISPDMQNRVFERFFRARDKRVSTFPGLGLGLYIASEIVKRHGGTIGVNSVAGEGSEFYFEIPYN
jgi:two-component system CheB/CheR fusion protein